LVLNATAPLPWKLGRVGVAIVGAVIVDVVIVRARICGVLRGIDLNPE
jgi:hypothetical protein